MAVAKSVIMQSLKVVLMSSGIVFIALLISHSSSSSPSLNFSSLKSWLQPPYLYVIINVIILTIAFSSRLHHHHQQQQHEPHPKSDVISVRADQFTSYDTVSVAGGHAGSFFSAVSVADVAIVEEKRSVGLETVMEDEVADPTVEKWEKFVVDEMADLTVQKEEKLSVDERSTWSVPRQQGLRRQEPVEFSLSEKPLVTSRFGHHRKHAKLSPVEGGKALRVSKPKKHDTFESTWKAITEGRHVPLTRHIKNKTDTWQYQCRQINLLEDPIPPPKPVKKSETFNDCTNHKSPPMISSSKLKKEPSLGQDELNRRVEAFINKFNEEMRLQRQQSMQQFLEKINRAA